jgi:translation initiation factor IF-3
LKAKRASEWLLEGHRVKLDLYLRGRSKYLDKNFLKGRMDRLLNLLTTDYKIASEPQKSPKGLTVIVERAPNSKKKDSPLEIKENHEN